MNVGFVAEGSRDSDGWRGGGSCRGTCGGQYELFGVISKPMKTDHDDDQWSDRDSQLPNPSR